RLKSQILTMLEMTRESIMLSYTRDSVYAVDAESLKDLTTEQLRYPLATPRLIGLGTFLGKWVARCTRGDENEVLIEQIRTPGGFLKHRLEMEIITRQRPLLTEGSSPIDIGSLPVNKIPQPRWRKMK